MLDQVPVGAKDDRYFIVRVHGNIHRNIKHWWDDCSAWDRSCTSTKKNFFVKAPGAKLRSLRVKKGLYGMDKPRGPNGQRVFAALDPQPDAKDVFILYRCYIKLKSPQPYEKRITWIISEENAHPSRACHEYKGVYPGDVPAEMAGDTPVDSATDGMSQDAPPPHDISASALAVGSQTAAVHSRPSLRCARATGGTPLPPDFRKRARFLDAMEMIELLTQSTVQALDHVPLGVKENVYYVVKNDANAARKLDGKTCKWRDDTGVYCSKSGSAKRISYVKSPVAGEPRRLETRSGIYGVDKCVEGRRTFEALNPQPKEDDLITVSRYCSKLRMGTDYERRISWIEPFKPSGNVACVEYKGTYPGYCAGLKRGRKKPPEGAPRKKRKSRAKPKNKPALGDEQDATLLFLGAMM